jgi:hypothetical protein
VVLTYCSMVLRLVAHTRAVCLTHCSCKYNEVAYLAVCSQCESPGALGALRVDVIRPATRGRRWCNCVVSLMHPQSNVELCIRL